MLAEAKLFSMKNLFKFLRSYWRFVSWEFLLNRNPIFMMMFNISKTEWRKSSIQRCYFISRKFFFYKMDRCKRLFSLIKLLLIELSEVLDWRISTITPKIYSILINQNKVVIYCGENDVVHRQTFCKEVLVDSNSF